MIFQNCKATGNWSKNGDPGLVAQNVGESYLGRNFGTRLQFGCVLRYLGATLVTLVTLGV